jgi:hypothetical protein
MRKRQGDGQMAVDIFDGSMYYREVAFCRVYSLESKEKLEKLFLKNRISYFIEWQDKPLLQRIFSRDSNKEKSFFTIRINEADVPKARELVQGIESIRLHKQDHSE